MSVIDRLTKQLQLIRQYEKKYSRLHGSVKLLAVSKKKSVAEISKAVQVGQQDFGESYVQESLSKIDLLKKYGLRWHFIGRIQSNKIKSIAEHFSVVHSVCSVDTAKKLNQYRPREKGKLKIYIQVNLDKEQAKAGVDVVNLREIVADVLPLPGLSVCGLMAIPKRYDRFEDQLNSFYRLVTLRDDLSNKGLCLPELSIGMSHDYEAAIAVGSTVVRLGTAIFGERVP